VLPSLLLDLLQVRFPAFLLARGIDLTASASRKINTDIVALKPFVCESELCLFQLISLGLGPSLEHEIKTNAPAVDLLIQLAYCAAKEGGMKAEMQPKGLSLQVPKDSTATWKKGQPTVDFDSLDVNDKNQGIIALISELPPVNEMKSWLNGDDLSANDKQLTRDRKLIDMREGIVTTSAWQLLRFVSHVSGSLFCLR
jgi:ubiquitin-conjugating enzyme E2 Q